MQKLLKSFNNEVKSYDKFLLLLILSLPFLLSISIFIADLVASIAAVTLILAQRLARKNCPDCRIPDEDITPKALADLGFTPEQASRARPSKGKGCPSCKDSGYKGRTGVYEILSVTKQLKEAILRAATTPELKEIAIKEGFRTMQDMGRQMLISGDLNFREYDRVLQSES